MNQERLVDRLLNPEKVFDRLLLVSVFCIALHTLLSVLGWDGFLLNLATEVVGIAVTVFYVGSVLKRRESEEWRIPQTIVASRLRRFVIFSIDTCFQPFYAQRPLMLEALGRMKHSDGGFGESFLVEMIGTVTEEVMPDLLPTMYSLDTRVWQEVGELTQSVLNSTDRLLLTCGDRLTPEQWTRMLEIQDATERMQMGCNFMAVSEAETEIRPASDLKHVKEIAREEIAAMLRKETVKNIAMELKNLLDMFIMLYHTVRA